jgi:hypothetical protein
MPITYSYRQDPDSNWEGLKSFSNQNWDEIIKIPNVIYDFVICILNTLLYKKLASFKKNRMLTREQYKYIFNIFAGLENRVDINHL